MLDNKWKVGKYVDYRNVFIHHSKPLPFDEGQEYTDDKNEASQISVFLETHYKDENGEEESMFDVEFEKEFDIKKLGYDKAKDKAISYAIKLSKKYDIDYEWY